jgi:hypothetical protein
VCIQWLLLIAAGCENKKISKKIIQTILLHPGLTQLIAAAAHHRYAADHRQNNPIRNPR